MYEDVCYNKNFISEVIFRMDFASPIVEFNKSMPKTIYKVVKKYYPIAEPQDIIGTELSINPLNGPVLNQVTTKQWVFLSRNRRNKCTIQAECIIFSISLYSVFEDEKNAFKDIVEIVMQENPDCQGKRMGLRYINNIPLKDHSTWIDEKFYAAISAHKDNKTTKLLTTLEYAVAEKDLNVRLNYGFNNPDYPAPIKRDEFIIDIDAYTSGIIYVDDLEEFIFDMHNEVQTCFEKMITDDFRNALNEKD